MGVLQNLQQMNMADKKQKKEWNTKEMYKLFKETVLCLISSQNTE